MRPLARRSARRMFVKVALTPPPLQTIAALTAACGSFSETGLTIQESALSRHVNTQNRPATTTDTVCLQSAVASTFRMTTESACGMIVLKFKK